MFHLGPGCAHGIPDIDRTDSVDELRRFLQEQPKHPERHKAIRRIQDLEYAQAVQGNSRFGYALYLERHPASPHQFEIDRRLQSLDYEEAKASPELALLLDHIRRWPRGEFAHAASKLLADRLCRGDLESSRFELLGLNPEEWISDVACLERIQATRHREAWKKTQITKGSRQLVEFLATKPPAQLAFLASQELAQRLVTALLQAWEFHSAAQWADFADDATSAEMVKRVIQAREATVGLDCSPRQAVPAPGTIDQAQHVLLGRRCSEPVFLEQASPLDRWQEALHLGLWAREETLAHLFERLADPYLAVRLEAWNSLTLVVATLGQVRAEYWLSSTLAQTAPKALTGPSLVQSAALYILLADPFHAVPLLNQRVADRTSPDLLALLLLLELEVSTGEHRAALATAKRLVEAAIQESTLRTDALESEDRIAASAAALSLMQLEAQLQVWSEGLRLADQALDHLTTDGPERDALESFRPKALAGLESLAKKYSELVARHQHHHPDFQTMAQIRTSKLQRDQIEFQEEQGAFDFLLGKSPASNMSIVLYTSCCHPRAKTRTHAHLRLQSVQLAWQVLGGGLSPVSSGLPAFSNSAAKVPAQCEKKACQSE